MLAHVLVAVLALGAVRADNPDGPNHRVTCGEVTPITDVDYAALSGNWVPVETVGFKDGHPFVPENDKRPSTCLYAKASDATDHGLKVTVESRLPGEDLKTEVLTIETINNEKGRLSLHSDVNNRENWEFLVLDAEPSKYLVYMLCSPPNEAGERLPERVNLLSRHADHSDHEIITQDEELQIERRMGGKLHLTGAGIKPVKFSHDCWASYAEPQ